jgi:hypothetical protein
MNITAFWNVTPYSVADRYQRFGEKYCLYVQGRRVCQAWHTAAWMLYKDYSKVWQCAERTCQGVMKRHTRKEVNVDTRINQNKQWKQTK